MLLEECAFQYGPEAYLTQKISFRLFMIQEHMVLHHMVYDRMVLEHKSRPESPKSVLPCVPQVSAYAQIIPTCIF